MLRNLLSPELNYVDVIVNKSFDNLLDFRFTTPWEVKISYVILLSFSEIDCSIRSKYLFSEEIVKRISELMSVEPEFIKSREK